VRRSNSPEVISTNLVDFGEIVLVHAVFMRLLEEIVDVELWSWKFRCGAKYPRSSPVVRRLLEDVHKRLGFRLVLQQGSQVQRDVRVVTRHVVSVQVGTLHARTKIWPGTDVAEYRDRLVGE
jgi:hypothetical protein